MPEIKVYLPTDGRVVIRWPKGTIPDTAVIMYAKKNPSTCANMQKGSTENGTKGQTEYTASGAENQELETLFQQLTQEEKQASLKWMQDIKEGRA